MQYYSTQNRNLRCSFKDAVLKGQPTDRGLYMPESIPLFDKSFIQHLSQISFQEIALSVARVFIGKEIPEIKLQEIIEQTLNFDIPLVKIHDNIYTLELFHGPTGAFKDVGARFLSECLHYFQNEVKNEINILVATSGDTGSAVGNGFYNVPGIQVVILYPSKKISKLQEQQLTTLGNNITALEIEGTFDDCQQMVKDAFADKDLNEQLILSSANSISIARLVPQTFYYFKIFKDLGTGFSDPVISVPCGNFGNLTAGLIAKRMGLPVKQFLAATNINDIVPQYLKTQNFVPRKSIRTLSNAMDIGNPSNFARIKDMFDHRYQEICKVIEGYSFNDKQTLAAIDRVNARYNYILDPHGAIGYAALNEYIQNSNETGIFLETAHPAKFINDVQQHVEVSVEVPEQLKSCLNKEKKSIIMANKFEELKEFLLSK